MYEGVFTRGRKLKLRIRKSFTLLGFWLGTWKFPTLQLLTWLCSFSTKFIVGPWRRKWQPTPVLLPGESHGRRSLVGWSGLARRVGKVNAKSIRLNKSLLNLKVHSYWPITGPVFPASLLLFPFWLSVFLLQWLFFQVFSLDIQYISPN